MRVEAETCPECEGGGNMTAPDGTVSPCDECDGTGEVCSNCGNPWSSCMGDCDDDDEPE